MSDSSFAGRRVLVVGASSGIGRAVAEAAAAAGATTVAAARRASLLDEVASGRGEGGGVHPIPCDVTVPGACEGLVDRAVDLLGGLDALVYSAGISPLARLRDCDAGTWSAVLGTNLVGAALVTRAALPHLAEARGRAAYLSSPAATRPWPGLVAYSASKAGLYALVAGFRLEAPEVSFTTVAIGPTLTGFADGWDQVLAAEMFPAWQAAGYLSPELETMTTDQVAAEVIGVLASPVRVPELRLDPDRRG